MLEADQLNEFDLSLSSSRKMFILLESLNYYYS